MKPKTAGEDMVGLTEGEDQHQEDGVMELGGGEERELDEEEMASLRDSDSEQDHGGGDECKSSPSNGLLAPLLPAAHAQSSSGGVAGGVKL